MANKLGSLVVSLGLDAAEFTKGMTKAEYQAFRSTEAIKGQLLSIGKYVAGLGVGAAFVESVRSTADFADEMGKLAQRAGTTAEDISKLSYAARQADVDNALLAKALRALGEDAIGGGEKLAALGIKANDASGKAKASAQLFSEVAEAIANMESPQQKAAAAAELLGAKVGPELIPLLNQGASGLKDMADEAERFGRVVTDDAVRAAETMNDNLTKLQEAGAGLAAQLAGPVIQSLADASSYFIKISNDVGTARAMLISFGAAFARAAGLDDVGRLTSQAKANANAVALTVKQIETFQRLADAGDAGAAARVAQLREQYQRLQSEGQKITSTLKQDAADIESSFAPVRGAPLEKTPTAATGGKPARNAATTKDPDAQFNAYLSGLKRQFEAAQNLGVVERTLQDIQLGRIGVVSEAQRTELLNIARLAEQMEAGKEAAKRQEDADRQAAEARKALQEAGQRYYEATRTDQERLLISLTEIDRLQQAGAISAETAARATAQAYGEAARKLEELSEEQRKAQRLASEFGSAFGNAATDVIFNSASAADAVRNLGIEIAKIIIQRQVIEPLATSAGNLLAGWVSSFDGGGYTGSGARSGGVDGKGGFAAILHPNETVIDHTKAQGMGGVTVVQNVTIDARGADAGVEARIHQAMRQAKAEAVAEVSARAQRGGSYSKALGRA